MRYFRIGEIISNRTKNISLVVNLLLTGFQEMIPDEKSLVNEVIYGK